MLDPERRESSNYAAFEGDELVGFFQFEREGETVDVGLGLRLDLTGRGFGLGFMLAGLEFARLRLDPGGFSLSVATFNERAGFRRGEVYTHHTNGADHPFLRMAREA